MPYSNYYLKNSAKIPTIVAIPVILVITFLIAKYFFTPFQSTNASKKRVSHQIVSNLSPSQATIIWQSDQKETGWIVYGKNSYNLSEIAYDERDTPNTKNNYYFHSVSLKDLNEGTSYYYKIVSGNELVSETNSSPFTFATLEKGTSSSQQKPAYGKVVSSSGKAVDDAIVILKEVHSKPHSAITKTTGEWLMSLNYIIDNTAKKTKDWTTNDVLTIEINNESKETSTITTDIAHLSPLPDTVVLGKNYNFSQKENVLGAQITPTGQIKPQPPKQSFDIIYPKDKAIVPASSPLIKGTGNPNDQITVSVNPQKGIPFTGTTSVDSTGVWKVVIKNNLGAGDYTIVATAKQNGQSAKKTRTFTIAKSGESVLAEATQSATPTSVQVTPTPTGEMSPTPTGELVSQTPTPPVTGLNTTPYAIASVALILLGLGMLFAF